jgi:hypothetical protein
MPSSLCPWQGCRGPCRARTCRWWARAGWRRGTTVASTMCTVAHTRCGAHPTGVHMFTKTHGLWILSQFTILLESNIELHEMLILRWDILTMTHSLTCRIIYFIWKTMSIHSYMSRISEHKLLLVVIFSYLSVPTRKFLNLSPSQSAYGACNLDMRRENTEFAPSSLTNRLSPPTVSFAHRCRQTCAWSHLSTSTSTTVTLQDSSRRSLPPLWPRAAPHKLQPLLWHAPTRVSPPMPPPRVRS